MEVLDKISKNNLRIERLEKIKSKIISEKENMNILYDYSIECFESEIKSIKRENDILSAVMNEENIDTLGKRYIEYIKQNHEEIIKKKYNPHK